MRAYLLIFLLPLIGKAQYNKGITFDSYMQAQYKVKQFNGAVLVVKNEKVLYEKAFGEADKEWSVPNTVNTRFKIGSNTKQFTACCILTLAEEGKLHLEDKLSKYFPDYPKGDSINIHMLLSHTSGIANYTDLDEYWDKAASIQLNHDTVIAMFKYKPLDFPAGTQCRYSNSGYILLGRIIEIVSGENYANYLNRHIIAKAGLLYTRMDTTNTVLPFRARGYYKRNGVFFNAGYINVAGIWSAGALNSTINDLYIWTKALHSNKVVTAASKKIMSEPQGITANKEKFGYGLIIDSVGNHPRIWHDGGVPGFTSYIAYYPAADAYIIALSNNSFIAGDIGNGLSHVLFNLPIELPYIHKEIDLPDTMLNKFVGSYEGSMQFEIVMKSKKLFRKSSTGREIALKPESDSKLFCADDSDRQLVFELNNASKITKVYLVSSGIRTEIKKVK